MATDDFFRARLDGMVDPRHPLVVLATRLPWTAIEATQVRHFRSHLAHERGAKS